VVGFEGGPGYECTLGFRVELCRRAWEELVVGEMRKAMRAVKPLLVVLVAAVGVVGVVLCVLSVPHRIGVQGVTAHVARVDGWDAPSVSLGRWLLGPAECVDMVEGGELRREPPCIPVWPR